MKMHKISFLITASCFFYAVISVGQVPDEQARKDKYSALKKAVKLQRQKSWIDRKSEMIGSTDFGAAAEESAGVGRTVLTVREASSVLADVTIKHRSYNGRLFGPAIYARPGETLEILLKNELSVQQAGEHATDINQPHGFNDTNLHTHGLHVSPSGDEDNVLAIVRPNTERVYSYQIPEYHPPGTHWYHAHKHGAVALQLASGMAGPLIVEGGLDFADFMTDIDDQILVIQQFVFSENEDGVFEVAADDVYGLSNSDRVDNLTVVNGDIGMTIRMRPGQIKRWRVIHAGLNTTLNLRLTGHELHEIAADGITFGYRGTTEMIPMHPGNRSDFLVQASTELGVYYLINRVSDSENAIRSLRVPETYLSLIHI